ncbi:hypothetical protein CVD25_09200 [Bacillus canaveralius]|uniref:Uncharacterized protein n=1 Tax=Bacillus canaveralius TaxID=1403243 RepID=A0A2N5GKX5_9BACI|nr:MULTISPECIES: hypothetical protein [Bacillus]PLR82108.1 hypothetical protein CU635_13140 [Bacillus canaveralius]PLR83935.1 hypothetical protein CVD23_12360 [Bacillus sp. V33-4]PLR97986.1 hypothetical protein CVD25_09200 [Bacillus canaveralius]RSK54433.1 hypothetical protein EJA13_05750 [Bacillus canaveralius]
MTGKDNKLPNSKKNMDHPEQYPTENESLFDRFESEKNVDPIPMEDLKQEQREEKEHHKTKQNSSTEEKYKADYRVDKLE